MCKYCWMERDDLAREPTGASQLEPLSVGVEGESGGEWGHVAEKWNYYFPHVEKETDDNDNERKRTDILISEQKMVSFIVYQS